MGIVLNPYSTYNNGHEKNMKHFAVPGTHTAEAAGGNFLQTAALNECLGRVN